MPVRRSTWPDSRRLVDMRRLRCSSWGRSTPRPAPPDVQQAEARYQEALMLAEELGMRPLQAHCPVTGKFELPKGCVNTHARLFSNSALSLSDGFGV
jgi:hypothetical protein